MPDLSPDTWAQIRADYEHSERPVADICAEHGISPGTLRDRVRRWRWTPRRPLVPRQGPPAVAAPRESASPPPMSEANGWGGSGVGGLGAMTTIDPPTPLRLADASRSGPPHRFAGGGMERAAPSPETSGTDDTLQRENEAAIDPATIAPRLQSAVARVLPAIEATLATLAAGPQAPRELERTARALGALMRTLRELNALLAQQPPRAALDDDDIPEDIDEFRERLAQRIDAFMEARGDEEFEEEEEEATCPGPAGRA